VIWSACHADARHVKLPQALIDEPFAAKIEVWRSITRLRAANPTTKRVRPSCSRRSRIIAALRTKLQRVRAELEEATSRLAKEETARLALEIDNVKLSDERQRLNGIVTAQQDDLRKLSTANVNIKRRIRRAAIAASVIVAVGLTTWFSGAHALFLAGH
jgi:chromosome segregation ATPase